MDRKLSGGVMRDSNVAELGRISFERTCTNSYVESTSPFC